MKLNFRQIPPPSFPVTEFEPPVIRNKVLDNGVLCRFLNSAEMELIRLDFKFKSGSWYQQKAFVSSFTAKMLTEGTKSFSSQQLAESLDGKGIYYGVSPEFDNIGIVFYIPQVFFIDSLAIIYEMIFDAIFPQKELDLLVNKEEMSLKVNLQKSSSLSRYHFRSSMFGNNHPYGVFPELSQIKAIKREDLVLFYEQHIINQLFTIYLTGHIEAEMLEKMNKVFGKSKKQINTLNAFDEKPISSTYSEPQYFELENSVQSSVRIGRVCVNRKHSDYIDLSILTSVLGGYFGSRLMTNIREEKGYTYGVGSSLVSFIHSGFFMISTDVGKDVCSKAITEIYKEMDRLCQDKIPSTELDRVKKYLEGSMLRSMDGAVNIMDKLIDTDDYGYGVDYFKSQMIALENINPERLRDLAQTYFNRKDMVEVVAG